jgi:serine/threonine-protein kinase
MEKPHEQGEVIKERYRVQRVLGQGGMGRVYLADDLRLSGRLCALKAVVYGENLPEDVIQQTRGQFQREANVLARLDHPNLPKVSDYFSIENRDYLVMDYVPGDDLLDLARQAKRAGKKLPERDVLNWASQIAQALIYLHSQEPVILHRDIKPSNIKLTPNGVIKLVDFGLVKLLASGEKTITVVQGHGTAYYTPLEQYGGDTGHTDPRSDVYSFGATLYHLLTLKPPLEARKRFLNPGEMKTIQDVNPDISPRTERAVMAAMEVHPRNRLQSVEEFKRALLGDWNPVIHPQAALPGPKIRDLFEGSDQQVMIWLVVVMFLTSVLVTIVR